MNELNWYIGLAIKIIFGVMLFGYAIKITIDSTKDKYPKWLEKIGSPEHGGYTFFAIFLAPIIMLIIALFAMIVGDYSDKLMNENKKYDRISSEESSFRRVAEELDKISPLPF